MKVNEAKQKSCAFMDKKCVAGECMAWIYTKESKGEDIIYTFSTNEFSEDKSKLSERHILIDEERGLTLDRKYAILIPLDENEKEGYCKRLEK